jgi:hypothetical protein
MISKAPDQADGSIDALYVTADQPHQLSLYAEPEEVDYGLILQKKIDAVYVTRFQKERWTEKERPYPKIDAKFLGEAKYSQASVMHPLPRVNELDASLDGDRRAIYFRQAAYGVPVRMALIALLLRLHKNKSLYRFAGGFAKPDHPLHVQPIGSGIECVNANCITHDPAERQYAANKFYVVGENAPHHCRLRCLYCETDIEPEVAAHFVVSDTARSQESPRGLTSSATVVAGSAATKAIQSFAQDWIASPPLAMTSKQPQCSTPSPTVPQLLSSAISAARFRSAWC